MIGVSFATLPHPLKSNGNKAEDRQRGRTTLLGVGWFLPSLPLGWRLVVNERRILWHWCLSSS
jgi:hypothetical protein